MVIVMALVMVVNKKATFQDDYQCCGDDDGDDVDVFKNRRSDGERHGNGDGDEDDGGEQRGWFKRWSLPTSLAW